MSAKPLKSEPIKTVLVITLGMIAVFFLTKSKKPLSAWSFSEWSLGVGFVVGVLGLLSDFIAQKIDFGWSKLTWLLSLIMPNIILSITFYLFLTPFAFIAKVFGEKNMLSLKNTKKSLFKEITKDIDKASFEKPW